MADAVPLSPFGSRERRIGIAAAAALHLALASPLVVEWPSLPRPPAPPQVIEVRFEPPPPPPPPPEPPLVVETPPPPAPEATLLPLPPPPVLDPEAPVANVSRPAPTPGPETPRPGPAERPQGRAREAPAPPSPPPPPLVLRGGGEVVQTPRRASPPSIVDSAPFVVGRADRNPSSGGALEQLQRSEGDFILAQVMRHWLIDHRSRRFRDVVMGGPFTLNSDGTLGWPYGKTDPWQPELMFADWGQLQRPEMENVKVALETFMRAVRAAQPFQLPPNVTGGYPRRIRLYFAMGDL